LVRARARPRFRASSRPVVRISFGVWFRVRVRFRIKGRDRVRVRVRARTKAVWRQG
jgi:hypothetical protein